MAENPNDPFGRRSEPQSDPFGRPQDNPQPSPEKPTAQDGENPNPGAHPDPSIPEGPVYWDGTQWRSVGATVRAVPMWVKGIIGLSAFMFFAVFLLFFFIPLFNALTYTESTDGTPGTDSVTSSSTVSMASMPDNTYTLITEVDNYIPVGNGCRIEGKALMEGPNGSPLDGPVTTYSIDISDPEQCRVADAPLDTRLADAEGDIVVQMTVNNGTVFVEDITFYPTLPMSGAPDGQPGHPDGPAAYTVDLTTLPNGTFTMDATDFWFSPDGYNCFASSREVFQNGIIPISQPDTIYYAQATGKENCTPVGLPPDTTYDAYKIPADLYTEVDITDGKATFTEVRLYDSFSGTSNP